MCVRVSLQPISACHCESANYTYWAEAHIKNRFLGNTLEVNPSGTFHVILKRTNEVRLAGPSRGSGR